MEKNGDKRGAGWYGFEREKGRRDMGKERVIYGRVFLGDMETLNYADCAYVEEEGVKAWH